MLDPYEKLANAIIIRAIKDYRMMTGTAETNPGKKEILDWIMSKNFSSITDLDPKMVVAELRAEEEKRWKK